MTTYSLLTNLHKARTVFNVFEYAQSELNGIEKWKQVFSKNRHLCISEFLSE